MNEHTREPWKVGYGPDKSITVIGTRGDVAWVFNPTAGLRDTSRSYQAGRKTPVFRPGM
jgi:hypothetical protein